MLEVSTIVVQQVKYEAVVPRPSDFSPRVQPMIENPGFFAWPSGHATQAFALAELLSLLTLSTRHAHSSGGTSGGDASRNGSPSSVTDQANPWSEGRAQLMRLADRIATNRVVAGLHFPIDNEAGAVLGMWLARRVIQMASGAAVDESEGPSALRSEGDSRRDFDWYDIAMKHSFMKDSFATVTEAASRLQPGAGGAGRPIGWLWRMARGEWLCAGTQPPSGT
jgi:hypothetical protein